MWCLGRVCISTNVCHDWNLNHDITHHSGHTHTQLQGHGVCEQVSANGYTPNNLDKLAISGQPGTVFNLLISHQQGMSDLSRAHLPNVGQNSLNLCL